MTPVPDEQRTLRAEAVSVAVQKLSGELVRLRQGIITDDEFRPTRTILGVYGQRQPEEYMVRVRLPYGAITPEQLCTLAQIARNYGAGVGHVTTRQDIQLHWLPLDAMPGILDTLSAVGITSLQAGGNSVRNVAACPLAGSCSKEAFDVTHHAAAVDDYYTGNPRVQSLPRKFKSSFSGCQEDCALSAIQDFGAVAVQRRQNGATAKGFRVYVGGGLGSIPRPAMLLEDFIAEDEVLPTYEAVIRTFDRLGDRTKKDRARLKFVVSRLGEEEFRRVVREEREAIKRDGALFPPVAESEEAAQTPFVGTAQAEPGDQGYERWLRWNVVSEKQAGFYSIAIPLPLGDIVSEQMEDVAALAESLPGASLRTTVQQNMYLRGVPESALPDVYQKLSAASLTAMRANGIADITSCPGTSACSLAIAASKGLAREVQQTLLEGDYQDDDVLGGLRIKSSGCPDSCSQHHLADIGLCAATLHQDGRLYPAQTLYLGGKVDDKGTRLGQPILKIPSRRAPQALLHLLSFYKAERHEGETFDLFVDRVGVKAIRDQLKDFTSIPPFEQDPSNFVDWDSTRMYILERGEGECSV